MDDMDISSFSFLQGKYECLAVNTVGEDVAELQLTGGGEKKSKQLSYAHVVGGGEK